MKIAHIVWGMKTGGVETMLVNIINEQVKTEEVCLFVINDFIDEFLIEKVSPKCKICRLNRVPGSKNPIKIIRLNYWIWRYKPDIIHVHSYQQSKLIYGNWNFVRTIHGLNNIPKEYPRMKALFSISNAVRDFTLQQGFQSIVVVNGINVAEMKKKQARRLYEPTYHLVQVSRLDVANKGQDILLHALNCLVKNNVQNFCMHFVGSGDSEGMLKDLTRKLSIEDFVVFEGIKTQDFLYQHLCEYDVFIQPSRSEGFGLTLAEAMAAKLPVLVSNIDAFMEVIDDGKYGMYFQTEDVNDLVEKLLIILQGGYDYSLVDKAYEYVCKEFDVRNTVNRYLKEYNNVIKNEKNTYSRSI